MLDLQQIRKNPSAVNAALAKRNPDLNINEVLALDEEHRKLLIQLEDLNRFKNEANVQMAALKKQGADASAKISEMKKVSDQIAALRPKVDELAEKINSALMNTPNLPADDVPSGGAFANQIIRKFGEPKTFDFKPKSHVELGEALGILNFAQSSKISGSSFILFKKDGARLERALVQFMLDLHVREHGYTEVSPPHLVKRHCMEGTGQLPKFEEDMYRIYRGTSEKENAGASSEDLFLIPTAEVPVTNMHREEILKDELPLSYVAYTPCFRLEAGAYGKDTRGMVRVHQFDKVELVRFCYPEKSANEHELLLGHAEEVLKRLNLPYRVVLLASGDMGFGASKCYDIEVWAPGLDKWLETSSCSNFLDFQARRMGAKYKSAQDQKVRFVHTLNGSGVALARTFVAILENYQNPDGTIEIPEVLRPYMQNQASISF